MSRSIVPFFTSSVTHQSEACGMVGYQSASGNPPMMPAFASARLTFSALTGASYWRVNSLKNGWSNAAWIQGI